MKSRAFVRLFILIFLHCMGFQIAAQEKPNSIYLEILGNGIIYTINYDRMVSENLSGRIGVEYWSNNVCIPLTISYLAGFGNERFELGIGLLNNVNRLGFGGTVVLGYRYQSSEDGLIFRIGFTPLFSRERFYPWGGLSIGVVF